MVKGLFQLKSAKKSEVEGTAFAIDRTKPINRYLIVTAYHVVSEIAANNDSILLEDEDGFLSTANLISSTKSLSDYEKPENDYAVLEAFINKDYEIYKPINYSEINNSAQCSIRGASTHFEFQFTPFTAIYEGAVKTKFGKHILFLNGIKTDYLDEKRQPISTQELLKGTSGSPVTVNHLGQEFCIGILSQIDKEYRTPSRYAVPIFYVANEVTGLSPEVFDNQPSNITPSDYIDAIFGFNDDFVFSDDREDKRIWNILSNAHFREGNIDLKLKKVIFSDDFDRKSAEIRCAVIYYYARLLFKRGRIDDAHLAFGKLQSDAVQMSEKSQKKIIALVKSRRIVEDIGHHINNPGNILRAADWLDNNLTDPEYKAYEMASIFGKGIMNLFQSVNDLNESEKLEVIQIYNNQKRLHKEYPTELKKQEVVITTVERFIELWNASSNLCMDDIDSTIETGFHQAQYLHNNIFHIQCLLAMVVSFLIKEKKRMLLKSLL